jgi:hypothetical protein
MNGIVARFVREGRRIVRWYLSPIGLLSAVVLVVVVGLSTAELERIAICVLAAWLGVLLPYKLDRERLDRSRQVDQLSKRVSRVARTANKSRSQLASTRLELQSEIALTPTLAELSEWQQSIDRQISTSAAKVASLDQLTVAFRRQREATQLLHDKHAVLHDEAKSDLATIRLVLDSLADRVAIDVDVPTEASTSMAHKLASDLASTREDVS